MDHNGQLRDILEKKNALLQGDTQKVEQQHLEA